MSPNYTRRYLILGAILGLLVPIAAVVIDLHYQGVPFSLGNIIEAQASNPLLWVIDTTPVVLALFAAFAGRRQDHVAKINEELEDKFIERQQMVARLVALQNNLERQVEARTADLNQQKSQFEAAAQVASAIAGIHKLDALLGQSVDLVSDKFGYYHAGIYLLNQDDGSVVLQAASSPGGKRMLTKRYRLDLEKIGLTGMRMPAGDTAYPLSPGVDPAYLKHPDLPETRSTLMIPLKIQARLVGILDIQSKTAGAFSQEDIKALQLVGDQLAMAIETSQLLQEKQAALDSLNLAHQELTQKSWSQSFRAQPDIAFRCDSKGRILPLQDAEFPQDTFGEMAVAAENSDQQTLSLPLKIRNQVVGEARFSKPPESGGWTEDEISLLETLSDQVSVAMDSARLYLESQRQAERERLVADITTKLRETNDPQQILRTAVHELQTALRAQRAHIKFQSVELDNRGGARTGNGADETGSNGKQPEGAA